MKKDYRNIGNLLKNETVPFSETIEDDRCRDNILKYFEKELKLALNTKYDITDKEARDTLIKMFLIEDAGNYNDQELIKNSENSSMILAKFMQYCEKQYIKKNVTIH